MTPQVDPDAVLLARALAKVTQKLDPDWGGSGWTSSTFNAVRATLSEDGLTAPAQARGGTLPTARGTTVSEMSRINGLDGRFRHPGMEAAARAFFQNSASPTARIPTLAMCLSVMENLKRREPCKDEPEALVRLSYAASAATLIRHHSPPGAGLDPLVDELLWYALDLERRFPTLKGQTEITLTKMRKAIVLKTRVKTEP